MRLTRRQQLLLLAPFLLLVVPFLIWPTLFGFFASFTNYSPFRPNTRFIALRSYTRLLSDSTFRQSLVNIVLFTVTIVPAQMVFGLATAFSLRRDFRGRTVVRSLLLTPWLISPIASGVMWHYMFNTRFGLFNLFPALVGLPTFPSPLASLRLAFWAVCIAEVWRQSSFAAFLILPGLLAIPQSQWDNARLDGLSLLAQLRYVVIPRLRVLLLTVLLLLTGSTLGMSEGLLLLSRGGPGTKTMTPGLYSYYKAIHARNWPLASTAGWFITAGVLLVGLIYLLLLRHKEVGM
ncbi:MAG TPA: sugar ABC transporter permease [Aggregatilinea sp.]|uniref:carbohydrate ABC transporter permease n=1 Tax=Aggregatilinea sp. TaxID=2806333 RepID=UPI002BCC7EA9|nr:sugar ABC transporter permease [Aggregatilinea sp.]HML20872.1 sugar ABC transporter permease [Aggregatilinea sp.]